jgi:hypothetical protein
MWRLGRGLVGQCIYVNQDISFIGTIPAKVNAIFIAGKNVGNISSYDIIETETTAPGAHCVYHPVYQSAVSLAFSQGYDIHTSLPRTMGIFGGWGTLQRKNRTFVSARAIQ